MNTLLIALFILTLLFISLFIIISIIKKSFLDKNNLVYFIPLFLVSFTLYSIGYKFEYSTYDFLSFFECLTVALKSFAFDIERDYVNALLAENVLFKIDFYLVFVLCGITTISTFIGFIKVGTVNFFRLVNRIFRKDLNIVVGLNQLSEDFALRNKNTIILVSKSSDNLSKEQRFSFYKNGICYIVGEAKPKLFNLIYKFTRGKIFVFQFNDNVEEIKKILKVISLSFIKKDAIVEFNIMASDSNIQFINKKLTEARGESKSKDKIIATAFNIYNMIGKQFALQYNLAQFLPSSFLEKGLLKNDKNVSVAMIGSGKTANSILEYLILNNQFATQHGDKFEIKPINFHLFDYNEKSFDRRIINLFSKKDNPNLSAFIQTHKLNVKTNFDLNGDSNEMKLMPKPSDNNFVYYFVNVGSSLDNECLVNSIIEQTEGKNYVVFYCVDSANEEISFANKNVIPFGYKTSILDRNKISNSIHYDEASALNKLYNDAKGESNQFTTLHIIEKLSNVLNVISCEFKLNLLGLTKKENENKADMRIVKDIYFGNESSGKLPYEKYFTINTRNALRFLEHSRWYTYYYLNDFKPLPVDEIKLVDGKICHKKLDKKLHACVVSYYELDKVHKYEAELVSKEKSISFDETLKQVETYQYDSEELDEIISNQALFERKYY